jgi:hypothetical protein
MRPAGVELGLFSTVETSICGPRRPADLERRCAVYVAAFSGDRSYWADADYIIPIAPTRFPLQLLSP